MELEEAKKPPEEKSSSPVVVVGKQQSIAQIIYAENQVDQALLHQIDPIVGQNSSNMLYLLTAIVDTHFKYDDVKCETWLLLLD